MSNDERVLVRTNKTYKVAEPKGEASFVLKFDDKQIAAIAEGLTSMDDGEGVTVFLNVYENESEFEKGGTYLSTVLDIQTTVPQEQSNKFQSKGSKAAAGRNSVRSKLNKSFKSTGRGR